jgi:steroid delta-isomerase-like uncharacterized protein
MSVQDNIAVVRGLYEACDQHDLERAAQVIAEDCEWIHVATGRILRGRSLIVEGLRAWGTAFPDGLVAIENIIATGPWVVSEWHATGTNMGPLRGGPPTGRAFERRGCSVAEVRQHEIVRYREYYDRATQLRQLGLIHLI